MFFSRGIPCTSTVRQIVSDVPTTTLDNLLEKKFLPGNYIIGGGLLNKSSMLVIGGGPKSYKSIIACSMMCHLAMAEPLFGRSRSLRESEKQFTFNIPKAQTVLYLEQEIGEE